MQTGLFTDFFERDGVFARCQGVDQHEHPLNNLNGGDAGQIWVSFSHGQLDITGRRVAALQSQVTATGRF